MNKTVTLSDEAFTRLSAFIQGSWGIRVPPSKRLMLEARLSKRLRALGFSSYEQYCAYLFSPEGMENEQGHLADVVTTNKTEFFREPKAFDHLVNQVLPEMVLEQGAGLRTPLMVWSAACSTGQEPYTLAMVLDAFARRYPGFGFDYLILATDISSEVLEHARKAVYPEEAAAPVPEDARRRYLMRSKDRSKKLVRVVPELRRKVRYRRMNLMEAFEMRDLMDVVFCRNVIIYFDRATQANLLQRICSRMKPGGHLFMGHSETLNGLALPLESVGPTIYRKL